MPHAVDIEDAKAIHRESIDRFGGSHGVRDDGLLDSALSSPMQSAFGQDIYRDDFAKAARLCFEVVSQHPFVDGNKRAAALLSAAFLMSRGHEFDPDDSRYLDAVLGAASGTLGYGGLLTFFRENQVQRCLG